MIFMMFSFFVVSDFLKLLFSVFVCRFSLDNQSSRWLRKWEAKKLVGNYVDEACLLSVLL